MWDDVVIGKGEHLNCACTVRRVGYIDIAANSTAYWVSGCFLDTGMTIFKSSAEGRALTQLLDKKAPDEKIEDWLDKLVIRKLPSAKLKVKIKEELKSAFQNGRAAQAEEIRNAIYFR